MSDRWLGVDLSIAACGLAVVSSHGLYFVTTVRPKSNGRTVPERRAEILDAIKAISRTPRLMFNGIVMESIGLFSSPGMMARAVLIGLSATIEDWARCEGMPVISIVPSSWRKAILGTGKADKQDAINYVERAYQRVLKADAAEAICLAIYGMRMGNGGGK